MSELRIKNTSESDGFRVPLEPQKFFWASFATAKITFTSIIVYSCIIYMLKDPYRWFAIPRESNDKDMAAMLDERTIEANEESFVIVHQHGGNDVTCKRSISIHII